MDFTYERIEKICYHLKTFINKELIALDDFMYQECGYKKGNTLPKVDNTWKEFKKGQRWGGSGDAHCWFYKIIEVPKPIQGKTVVLKIITGQENDWDAINPQFIVYADGQAVQAMDINHTEVLLQGKDKYEVYIYAYTGMIETQLEFMPSLHVVDVEAEKLYYHLKVPLEVTEFLDKNDKKYTDILTYLNNAVNLLDLRIPYSAEYNESVRATINYMQSEFYDIYCGEQEMSIICIGHTHIDVAWLWTLEQTAEKAQRSFATVVNLMKRYPEYKFMSSQAQLYAYVKQEDPQLYEEIKKLIAEGRWEVEGAMWLEADCNLPSGESLVRQVLFGKRFFKSEFGIESHILWLPDVFGYSAALPQILQKSGVDCFITSKISWNETNDMPFDTFSWKGIDGTEILSYFMTAQDKKRGEEPERRTHYSAIISPAMAAGTWERYKQKELNNEALLTFGYGDGGGGPTAEMLEKGRRLAYGIPGCPNVKIDTATKFFKRLSDKVKDNSRLPKWVGELYLELHRGTYTSIAKNKRNNRKSEFLYQTAEWISCMNEILCGGDYPREKLNGNWEKILTRQFHDIIPGSSIGPVYDECDKAYAQIKSDGNSIVEQCMNQIAQNVKTDGGWLVFNPNSFEISGTAEVGEQYIYAENIPSKGYKIIPAKKSMSSVKLGDRCIENKFFKVIFNENYHFISLYDKRCDREVVTSGEQANVLQVFEDLPFAWDAWDISNYYQEKMWELNDVFDVKTFRNEVCAGFEITRKFLNSKVIQTILLYDEIDRVDFKTHIDWHEEHLLLKVAFPMDIHAEKATYDIQFGNVERSTHRNTSWEAAKFEVCAHKFADISEYGYGVSLLNDCKYGYDVNGNVMRLSLLKCATNPYKDADKGSHEFTYSLYPHKGTWRESDTMRHAFDLNNPLRTIYVKAQDGILPENYSLVSTDYENLIIDTVKKAEDSEDLIVRLYECANMRMQAKISFGFAVQAIAICDLMENEQKKLEVTKNSVSVKVKPFEIITLKVKIFEK